MSVEQDQPAPGQTRSAERSRHDGQSKRGVRVKRGGCLRRCGRGCGIATLILLALLLTGYLVEVYRCSRFTPTGDALFDAYARAVIHRQAWRLFHLGGEHPATLPDSVLQQWESEFGKDPRYWQLRYFCALNRHIDGRYWARLDPTEQDRAAARAVLEDARDRGVADLDALAMLLFEYQKDRVWYADDEGKAPELAAKCDQLVGEMESVDPDSAWPHYYRALWLIKDGSYPLALAAIHKGNQRKLLRLPRCYPLSEMYDRASHGMPAASDVLLGAAVDLDPNVAGSYWFFILDAPQQRGMTMQFFDWVAEHGTRDDLAACHQMACAIGAGCGGWSDLDRAAGFIVQLGYASLCQDQLELTGQDKRMVLAVIDRAQRLKCSESIVEIICSRELAICGPWNTTNEMASSLYGPPGFYNSIFVVLPQAMYFSHSPARWRLLGASKAAGMQRLSLSTWGDFANLALVDYRNLELPWDWRDTNADHGFPKYNAAAHPESGGLDAQ